jgi:anti-sigma regulatory factor (Ser/Thr protein kinase)
MANSDPVVRRAGQDVAAALEESFDVDGLYVLRSALVAHGSQLGASDAELERILIVASELATNAIRHGGGRGRLRLWRAGDVLTCELADDGPGVPDPAIGTQPIDPHAVGGRGLWICRQLADSLDILYRNGAIVTVTFTLRGPPGIRRTGHFER